MTEFEVTIDGVTDTIKAKHIINGRYLVRQLKTGNILCVKWIVTEHTDEAKTYKVAEVYPSSPHYQRDIKNQSVIKTA